MLQKNIKKYNFFYNFSKKLLYIILKILMVFSVNDINASQILYGQLPSEDIVLNSIGINSAYYNPANLGKMSHNEVKLSHLSYIADIGVESIALGFMIDKHHGGGVVLNYMHTEIEYNEDKYKGNISERFLSGKISYGYNIGDGKLVGIGIKFELDIGESSYKLPAVSAIDIGFTFDQVLLSDMALEFFIENFVSYSSELSIGKNLSLYSGILYRLNEWILSSIGCQFISHVPDIFSIGLQFDLSQFSKIELGYKYKYDEIDSIFNNLHIGIDIEYQKYRIGYGINPIIGFEETIHKFSIGFVF